MTPRHRIGLLAIPLNTPKGHRPPISQSVASPELPTALNSISPPYNHGRYCHRELYAPPTFGTRVEARIYLLPRRRPQCLASHQSRCWKPRQCLHQGVRGNYFIQPSVFSMCITNLSIRRGHWKLPDGTEFAKVVPGLGGEFGTIDDKGVSHPGTCNFFLTMTCLGLDANQRPLQISHTPFSSTMGNSDMSPHLATASPGLPTLLLCKYKTPSMNNDV